MKTEKERDKENEYFMKHGLPEVNYVAGGQAHCIKHCTVLADPEGMPIIRTIQPCTNHKLAHWEDCWECYLEQK